jgi:spermidine export protein MdtJ
VIGKDHLQHASFGQLEQWFDVRLTHGVIGNWEVRIWPGARDKEIGMLRYWLFMTAAIATEVIGTLAMKYGSHHASHATGLAVMYVMLVVSYTSLALAVKRIPLAVAYGAWESIGLVLITLCSAWLFAEDLKPTKLIAIALIIVGIVLLERGTDEGEHVGHHAA